MTRNDLKKKSRGPGREKTTFLYTQVKEDALFARSFATRSGLRVGKGKERKERRGEKRRLRSRTPLYVPPPDRYRLTVNLTSRIGVSATAPPSGTAGTQYLGRHAKDTGARVADTWRWPMQVDITEWQGWADDWLRALIWGTCRPCSQLEARAAYLPLSSRSSQK